MKRLFNLLNPKSASINSQREYPLKSDTASLIDNAQTILRPNDAMEAANEAATRVAKAQKEASDALSEYICMIDNKYRKVKKTGRTASSTQNPAIDPLIEVTLCNDGDATNHRLWVLNSTLYIINKHE